MPKNDTTKLLITQTVSQLNAVSENLAVIAAEMKRLAEQLYEYPVVMAYGGDRRCRPFSLKRFTGLLRRA